MEKRVANARKVCQDLHVIKSSNVKKDAVAMGVASEENVYVKLVTADRYAKRKLLAQYLSKEIYAAGMAFQRQRVYIEREFLKSVSSYRKSNS